MLIIMCNHIRVEAPPVGLSVVVSIIPINILAFSLAVLIARILVTTWERLPTTIYDQTLIYFFQLVCILYLAWRLHCKLHLASHQRRELSLWC
jgi:hypothetical protein